MNLSLPKHPDDLFHCKTIPFHSDLPIWPRHYSILTQNLDQFLGVRAGQMKMKQRQFRGVLGDIAKNMNDYYEYSAVPKVNLTCCIFYVVMGVFMLVFAGVFLFGFSKIL